MIEITHRAPLVTIRRPQMADSNEHRTTKWSTIEMSRDPIKAPFPWFGGKSRVAHLVWERFGDVTNYVEPFFGSGAVLLGRPHEPQTETINDADGFVANFWRAIVADPESVAHYVDWPVNENDQHARHAWLVEQRDELTAKLEGDPDYFDAKIAGWWCWGICCWIGNGWCSGKGPWKVVDRKLIHLGNKGQGVHRQLIHLGNKGRGVHRKLQPTSVYEWFGVLHDRLRRVRVCCGDWMRVLGPTPTTNLGLTGVLLDPPYDDTRTGDLYPCDSTSIAGEVSAWAAKHGEDPKMRIALCGYEGSFKAPDGWTEVAWKARGGYGSQGNGRGRANAARERIWFSPACLSEEKLFHRREMP